MATIDLLMSRSAPLELGLLAEALRARRPDDEVRLVDGGEGTDLEVRCAGSVVRIGSDDGRFLLKRSDEEVSIPWFLPIRPRASSSRRAVPAIGISGGADERRLRMSWRTIAELRSRSFAFDSVVLGRCEIPPASKERPDELHDELSPGEYLSALERLDVILECTDSFGTTSFLAIAGRDAGLPVVAHEDRNDLSHSGNGHSAIWSADGFAEAVMRVAGRRSTPADPTAGIERIAELIGVS